MYGYKWTDNNGIFRLTIDAPIEKEIRPVFKEELDFFGMNAYWDYPDTDKPLLWAEGIRRYIVNGDAVAEATGGGYYTKPKIKVLRRKLTLTPISVDDLWKENQALLTGMEQRAIAFIQKTYNEYMVKGYSFVVAFSGGKDSLLLLDLVAKALPPENFYVVFSNTGMELDETLRTIEKAKQHWPNLRFEEAKCHMDPLQSWDEFGPPGRRLRWCCAVHKSVPTILKLREITGQYDVQAVVFDGVRAEESARRAKYDEISVGAKNINQVNCSPILKWNTAELFTYLLHNNIYLNDAYRYGLFRMGCKVCPMSSAWWDGITNILYPQEMAPLLHKVEEYAIESKPEKERRKFIESGGWKARMGGRGLPNGGNRITEAVADDTLTFSFSCHVQSWWDVAPILGPIIEKNDNHAVQLIDRREYTISVEESNGLVVKVAPFSMMDRFVLSHLRGVANKVAYCIGCKACMVQCPFAAFEITSEGHILIHEERCKHCSNCITFTNGKGCLVAKSLSTTMGNNTMDLKGMNRYQHFGFRAPWLQGFFDYGPDYFTSGANGNRQFDALRVWLREAGLLYPNNIGENSGKSTPLCEKMQLRDSYDPFVWSIIWVNLAYSSIITKWYMLNATAGESHDKAEFIFMLGDDYSQATRDNAITALLETFKNSPIGDSLKQGIPIEYGNKTKYLRAGWENPDPLSILYCMYRWAEATERYSFTLSQMQAMRESGNPLGMDPVCVFGLTNVQFKNILQEIAIHMDKYLRVSFVADLDNISLDENTTSMDIIDLANEM